MWDESKRNKVVQEQLEQKAEAENMLPSFFIMLQAVSTRLEGNTGTAIGHAAFCHGIREGRYRRGRRLYT